MPARSVLCALARVHALLDPSDPRCAAVLQATLEGPRKQEMSPRLILGHGEPPMMEPPLRVSSNSAPGPKADYSLAICQIGPPGSHTSRLGRSDQRKLGLGSRRPPVYGYSSRRCGDRGASRSSRACFLAPLADDASCHQCPPPSLRATVPTRADSSRRHRHRAHEGSGANAYPEVQVLHSMAPPCQTEPQRHHPWPWSCERTKRHASAALARLRADPRPLRWIFAALGADLFSWCLDRNHQDRHRVPSENSGLHFQSSWCL
mmetsp:Transcript_27762/g.60480  ORF Transcript_27762/g.60480 Transcript_27762/m.60480 type:complete len:262 (+) Transcript_27762:340-1125(+)